MAALGLLWLVHDSSVGALIFFQVFPRFYFVSDDSLLSILSSSTSVESIKPHLSSLFNDVGSIVSVSSTDGGAPIITGVESCEGEVLPLNQSVSKNY